MFDDNYSYINYVSDFLLEKFNCFSDDVALFIGCQFALESNFGTSTLVKDFNNHCGMKNPLVRVSLSLCSGDSSCHWAHYDSFDDCILDYVFCIQYHRPKSVDLSNLSYFKHFIKFYCPEKDYVTKITSLFNQFKSFNYGKRN